MVLLFIRFLRLSSNLGWIAYHSIETCTNARTTY